MVEEGAVEHLSPKSPCIRLRRDQGVFGVVEHGKLIFVIVEIDAMAYRIEDVRRWINIRTCAQPISKT
jgi:hypothetical protein